MPEYWHEVKIDEEQLSGIGADKIDLVVVNLYPFEEELKKQMLRR